jgi:hypothetical protein
MNKDEFEIKLFTKVLNFVKLEDQDEVLLQMEEIAKRDVTMKIRVSFDLNHFLSNSKPNDI